MPLYFFPRDRQFWLYHCSALAAGLAVTIAMALMWGQMIAYQIAMSIGWVPLYTVAVLGFRWLYRRYGGERAGMGRLIAGAVLYSAAAGAVMACLLQAAVLPLFWSAIVARYAHASLPLDYLRFLLERVREQGPQNQMFVLAWSSFISA